MALRESRVISQEEFDEIYTKHQLWLNDQTQGEQMNLSNCNFNRIQFPIDANLRRANLRNAVVIGKVLIGEVMTSALLSGADLRRADLRGADLRMADLRMADLRMADLRMANLWGADLTGANLMGLDLMDLSSRGLDLSGLDLVDANLTNSQREFLQKLTKNESISQFSEIEDELQSLRRERVQLLANQKTDEDKKELEEKTEQIKKLLKEKSTVEEDTKKKLIDDIGKGFEHLTTANKGLESESKRLNCMFLFYTISAAGLLGLLVWVWMNLYCQSDCAGITFNPSLEWSLIRVSSSLLLLGLIWMCITQINRAQSKSENIKKFIHRIKSIRAVLECSVYTIETDEMARVKINEILDLYVKDIISTKPNWEEDALQSAKADEKHSIPADKVLKDILKIIMKSMKN